MISCLSKGLHFNLFSIFFVKQQNHFNFKKNSKHFHTLTLNAKIQIKKMHVILLHAF